MFTFSTILKVFDITSFVGLQFLWFYELFGLLVVSWLHYSN